MPILGFFYIFAAVPVFGALETFKFLKIMHLKKYPARVIRDLSDWSCEISLLNTWAKDGFSERDYQQFLRSVSKFLRLLTKYQPSDILVSSKELDK